MEIKDGQTQMKITCYKLKQIYVTIFVCSINMSMNNEKKFINITSLIYNEKKFINITSQIYKR